MKPIETALFTDLYELTMMQGYWASGLTEHHSCFELFFRSVPEQGGYCVAAGIEDSLRLLADLRFRPEHLDYLASLELFRPAFLEYLGDLRFRGDLRALPEGSIVFPHEPILEVTGRTVEAQWVETLLLNCVNFQTLIATKASRIVRAATPATVIEFGLRRAHGPNGGRWASKAAYAGGCVGTSNVEAGFLYGIPVYGTHAHSWIQSFPNERDAFRAYADAFPDHCIFLIDTYDTLHQGLPNAIAEAKRLQAAGRRAVGIRLDSGDLAYLAKACRAELDKAGLEYVKILASSDIDEYLIQEMKVQQAPIDFFGVGTRLVTAFQEPALGGVYKLAAIKAPGGAWEPKLKISSNPAKTTIPGRKQIWRYEADGRYQGDALACFDEAAPARMRHPDLEHKQTTFPADTLRPLLAPRMRGGELLGAAPSLEETRGFVATELAKLPVEHQRLANPHIYRVGLSDRLWETRHTMIERMA